MISAISVSLAACMVFALLGSSCGRREKMPAAITFRAQSLYPEGIDFDPLRREFVVSSMRLGTVGRVTPAGKYREIFRHERLKSTVGLRVDTVRDRILVCYTDHGRALRTSPLTKNKTAGVAVLRLSTGELIRFTDLAAVPRGNPARHGPPGSVNNRRFSNDIAIDLNTGTSYITDSFSPIIYRLDTDGRASIFLEHPRLGGPGVNSNGILFRGSYLLVAKYNDGQLFKIPLKKPRVPVQVRLPRPFPAADGLVEGPGGSVILIANGKTNQVVQLVSSDNWASARIKTTRSTGRVFATTGVRIGHRVYVAHAMLHRIVRDLSEPLQEFTIRSYHFP